MAHDFQADIDIVGQIAAVPKILNVVCSATGMGFAAVARVTEERWVACSVVDHAQFGLLPGGELQVESTICHEIRQHRQLVVIDDADHDKTYRLHHTMVTYGLRSYISVPILLEDGTFFGTLCAIDSRPRLLSTPSILGMFELFASLIAGHIGAHKRLEVSEAQLSEVTALSDLREQFIAVLGHDLRNPLAAVDAGARLLLRSQLDDKATEIVRLIQRSASRMSGLIDDVLDFARGRLGGGLVLNREVGEQLVPTLLQVVAELRASNPNQVIMLELAMTEAVHCDVGRIGQLLSNLLGNALTHGASETPIQVQAITRDGIFELSVANSGRPIPPAALERLFLPFFRDAGCSNQQGLGLGLYIASEIARAHGGRIDVVSTLAETRFTFRMQT